MSVFHALGCVARNPILSAETERKMRRSLTTGFAFFLILGMGLGIEPGSMNRTWNCAEPVNSIYFADPEALHPADAGDCHLRTYGV